MNRRVGMGWMAAMLLAAGVRGGEAANPILEKFADAVTFYVSYDEGDGAPMMAAGKADVRNKDREPQAVPGILGQGMMGGGYGYFSEKNVDLSAPGTVVLWIALRDKEKEAYAWPIRIATDRGMVIFGRQPGPRVYMHADAPKGADGKALEGKAPFYHSINGIGGFKDWGDGWHMLAFTWDAENAGISVDGAAPSEKALPEPLDGASSWFTTGMPDNAMDELAILNRKLTAEELKWLYDETLARAKAVDGK